MAGYRGKQGRKPKAATILERERAKESAPRPPRAEKGRLPSAPEAVRANGVAFAEWKKAGRILVDGGLLQKGDTTVLAAYCISYARWVDAEEHLRSIGVIVKTRFGSLVPSPYLPIANKSMEQTTKLAGELGLSPASRSRLPGARSEPRRPKRVPFQQGDAGEDPRDALKVVEGGKR